MLEEERLILLSPTALLYLTWSFEKDDMLLWLRPDYQEETDLLQLDFFFLLLQPTGRQYIT